MWTDISSTDEAGPTREALLQENAALHLLVADYKALGELLRTENEQYRAQIAEALAIIDEGIQQAGRAAERTYRAALAVLLPKEGEG
jgi:hypothetical protein